MKSIIYNYTLGYNTKEELAEYCAIVYGKNIFIDNIFEQLSESQHINEQVLDVADEITNYIFSTYEKKSSFQKDEYVKPTLSTCVGKLFYTKWNFHSIDDIIQQPFAKNASKQDVQFKKDSNIHVGHPIYIVFLRDLKKTTIGSNIRRNVIDELYQDISEHIKIEFQSRIEIQINYEWFVQTIQNNNSPDIKIALASVLSHELTHAYDQYKFASKNLIFDDKKNSIYIDFSEQKKNFKDVDEKVLNYCDKILYLMSYPEQRARLDGTASLFKNISDSDYSFNKQFDEFKLNHTNVNRNALLIATVLNNNYVKNVSQWENFRNLKDNIKTELSEEDFKRCVAIIGHFMLKHKLFNYDSSSIPIKPACVNMLLKKSALMQYLKDFTVPYIIDDSVSDILEFIYYSIDVVYKIFIFKIKKVIEKYIENLYTNNSVRLVYDKFNSKNTHFEYTINQII